MSPQLRDALPWIVVFIAIMLVLAFAVWVGYDHWSDEVL